MRGGLTPDMVPHETLAATSSQPKSEALPARMVLAHPRTMFHPCTCGLRTCVVAVPAALIGYDDIMVATETTTRRRWVWSTTSTTPTHDYVGSLLQLFFCCSAHLVVMIHDLLLASILRWHGRCSASVAYTLSFKVETGEGKKRGRSHTAARGTSRPVTWECD
jgi:hypothetical protein